MKSTIYLLAGSATLLAVGMSSQAADIGNDLKATIVLQGSPCDQIAQQTRNGDSDYNVMCKDGNHYRVYVDAKGRVIVQKT